MAWHRTGDKPLSEPMMLSLLTHICVTRPQWVKWDTIVITSFSKNNLPAEWFYPSQWRYNERDGVSNYQSHHCLLNRLFMRRSKKTSKLRVTGLCERNPGEFASQKTSDAENVSIWWRHHVDQETRGYRLVNPLWFVITHSRHHFSGAKPSSKLILTYW